MLLQLRQELLRVADDDDARAVGREMRRGELLDVTCTNRLHAADVAIDLVETEAVQRERSDAADDSGVRFELASEAADEDGLARSELRILHRSRSELVQFIDDQSGHFAGRLIFRLDGSDEETDVAAQIERAVRTVAEAPFDANLFIQARRIAAAED